MESELKKHRLTIKGKVINTFEVLWSLSILVLILIFCVITPLMHCVNDFIIYTTAITIVVLLVTTVVLSIIDEDFQSGGGFYY